MVVSTHLYDILGVSPDADNSAIKKAYRKKAMKYHPDRHSGSTEEEKKKTEEKFKEISGAYDVLSDERKRKVYDQLGEEGVKQAAAEAGMQDGPDFNIADLMGHLFGGGGGMPFGMGGMGGMGGMPGMGRSNGPNFRPQQPRKMDTMAELVITLEEAYLGCTKTIPRKWSKQCGECSGRGAINKDDVISCNVCKGQGVQIKMQQVRPGMVMQSQCQCQKCRGSGKQIKEGAECSGCNGRKVVVEDHQHEIRLPPGIRDGHQAKFSGEGNWEAEWPSNQQIGDMIFVIRIQYNKNTCPYRLEGDHLVVRKALSLYDALRGADFGIRTIDNRLLHIQSDKMLQTGDCLIVKGEGMPIIEGAQSGCSGDLRIYIKVVYPKDRTVNKVADKEKLNKTMQLLFRDNPTTKELDGRFHDVIGVPVDSTIQNSQNTNSTTQSGSVEMETPTVEHRPMVDDPANDDMEEMTNNSRSRPAMADEGMPQCAHQ